MQGVHAFDGAGGHELLAQFTGGQGQGFGHGGLLG
jgi:hypothetical protein